MIKTIRTILTNVSFIFRPTFWFSEFRVCKNWDVELNDLMDQHEATGGKFTQRDNHYTIMLNGKEVWTENYPYAYGRRWNTGAYYPSAAGRTPRRATRIRLSKLVKSVELVPRLNTAMENPTTEITKLKESA